MKKKLAKSPSGRDGFSSSKETGGWGQWPELAERVSRSASTEVTELPDEKRSPYDLTGLPDVAGLSPMVMPDVKALRGRVRPWAARRDSDDQSSDSEFEYVLPERKVRIRPKCRQRPISASQKGSSDGPNSSDTN